MLEGVVAASALRSITMFVFHFIQTTQITFFVTITKYTERAVMCIQWATTFRSHLADIPVRHALAVIPQWQWIALQTAREPWTDNMGGDRFTAQRSQPSSYVLRLSNWWVHFLTGPSGETGPGCLEQENRSVIILHTCTQTHEPLKLQRGVPAVNCEESVSCGCLTDCLHSPAHCCLLLIAVFLPGGLLWS